jgi:uncharacterized integral membrane protein
MFQTIKEFFAPPTSKKDADITMKGLLQVFVISLFLIPLFLTVNYYDSSPLFVFTNTAVIILATSISGFLIGFIFGIPRSVRFRFDKTKDKFANLEGSDNVLADNTNLEEISDWITKIIIGLTLIEGRKIIRMIENGANSIAKSYPECGTIICDLNLFVFAYCLMVFFAGYGNLSNADEITEAGVGILGTDDTLTSLKEKVVNLLNATLILDKTDTQKGRWGGLPISNDRTLTAKVQPTLLGLYDVTIEVTSTNVANPLISTVVILLDSTFAENEIYLKPVNNVAKVTVVAYEAFTIAALCDNLETKLELDLQQQKGLPPKFYYEK